MSTAKNWFRKHLCRCLAVILVPGLFAAPSAALGPPLCEDAVFIEPGGAWSGYGRGEVLAFDVSSKGFFGLQASAPATSAAEPQLVALGRGCTGGTGRALVLRRYLSGYLLRVEQPGIYYFFVGPQNPDEPLGEVEVRSRFAISDGLGIFLAKGLGEGEDDPDPLVPPGYCEIEDDHSDTFDCASDLGWDEPVPGEIHFDDADVFTFQLDDQATVRIESVSEIDLIGSLYDENGYRLALDDDSGQGEDFQITRTLSAGVYFVKVEGHGAVEGSYALTGELVTW